MVGLLLVRCLCDTASDMHRCRPIVGGERVPVAQWNNFRQTNIFQAPSCFCCHLVPDAEIYTEIAVFIAPKGPFAGYYIGQCANGTCSYLGEHGCGPSRRERANSPFVQ